MARESERLARAIRNSAKRESLEGSLDIRAGTVLFRDLALRVAQIKLDGDVNASSVKWLGGTAPSIGDKLHVLIKDGVKTVINLSGSASDTAAAFIPPPTSAVSSFGLLTGWGHSWMDTVVGNQGQTRFRAGRFADRLAGMVGLDWPNYRNRGISGEGLLVSGYAAIQNGVMPDRPALWPYVATSGHHFIVTGLNDVAVYGPFTTQVLDAWKHAWRSSLARLWAGGVFEPLDATFVYAGTGWSTVTSPWNPSRSIRQTVNQGAGFNWNVPADFSGGYVNLRFVGEQQGVQAGATAITVTAPPATTGGPTQTFTIATHNAMTGRYSTVNHRIALAKTGTVQTINATATTLAAGGRMAVDCAEIEDTKPPMVVAQTVAKPFNWAVYTVLNADRASRGLPAIGGAVRSGTTPPLGALPEDAWLDAINLSTLQVFTEFGQPAMLGDQGLVMDGRLYPERYMDNTHPNESGDVYIARQFYDAFALLQGGQDVYALNAVTPHEPEDLALWNSFVGAD